MDMTLSPDFKDLLTAFGAVGVRYLVVAALVDTGRPWHTRFWMGGWDGDLMIGWMQGSLQIPLRVHSS